MKKHDGGIESYSDEYLECRGDDHAWRWLTDANIVKNSRGRIVEWSRVRECQRCGSYVTKRYDARTGRILGNSYTYSEGYLASKNSGIDAGTSRLERLRRIGIDIGD